MGIYAKAGANFTPAPAGTHGAVCVDIVDLGEVKTEYQGKARTRHVVKIVWQIDELRDDGLLPFALRKTYTLSLHEKATLRKDLESWRGKAFTEEELRGFDLEVLLSKGCLLNVIHREANGSTYANVSGIMKLPKGMQAPTPTGYVRECDRPQSDAAETAPLPGGGDDWNAPPDDESVPF